MKKSILLGLFLLHGSLSFSQSFEQKIAVEACNCISKFEKATEKNYSDCFGSSFSTVFFAEKDQKVKEKANSVEGITQIMKEVFALLPTTCTIKKTVSSNDKKSLFYTASKNEKAMSSYIIGKDLMNNSKYEQAIVHFQKAVKDDKDFVLAYDDLAACYRQLNDYDNAIKYYQKSLTVFPEGDFALMNLGVVYTLKSDFKTAIDYYEKLITFEPNNAEGYFGAAKNYFQIKEYEKALNYIFIAHRIYTTENSNYKSDSEQILAAMYQQLKAENKESLFLKIAEKNNIKID